MNLDLNSECDIEDKFAQLASTKITKNIRFEFWKNELLVDIDFNSQIVFKINKGNCFWVIALCIMVDVYQTISSQDCTVQ